MKGTKVFWCVASLCDTGEGRRRHDGRRSGNSQDSGEAAAKASKTVRAATAGDALLDPGPRTARRDPARLLALQTEAPPQGEEGSSTLARCVVA